MSLIHTELTATCNSLGCAGPEKYLIDPQCTEAIRDLIKFLRRDSDDHEVRRHLGAANIVETDLLPILVEYSDQLELFDLIIRLLVNLTTPALLIYNEQPPAEKTPRQNYLQMLLHLQKYKRAFTNIDVWSVIVNKLAEVIQAEYYEKGQEKVLSTVRLLILVRNILHVPADNDAECRLDNDANLHDQVLWAMHQSQLIDIIMYIACSENEQQYYLHALEIISLMLRDQNAAELANASVNRTETEKQRDEHALKIVLEKERKDKLEKLKKYSGSRHSRFGGRFVVSGMKSIGENEMVVSSMASNVNKAFDRYKKPLKTPRNRMPLKEAGIERKSAFSVRLFLKEFCVEFLHGAYNTLMKHIREILVRSQGQPNDESYYFWAMQFFMEFNRNYRFEIKLISETMALNIFHFVQERIEDSREKLITDKKKIPIWSKRMHLGLKAYKELINTLLVMYQGTDTMLKSSAQTILTNLFYMAEYRDLLLSLLNLYDELKFSQIYLKDLIEANHIFMKLLEHLGKKQRNLIVQKKVKKKRSKKSNVKLTTKVDPVEDNDTMWTKFSPDLENIIKLHTLIVDVNEAKPYDPISEVSMEDQKVESMCRIRMYIRNKLFEEAIKLLRASREVWPEISYFGKSGLSNEDELDILKQIFYADLRIPAGYNENTTQLNDEAENSNNDEEDKEDEEDEEDEEFSHMKMEETNFEFVDFVKKYAKPRVLQNCCILLKEFDKNSSNTNHAVVKLLHRITYDCKYSALMFQASVFRVFQRIFVSKDPSHKELKHFAIFITRKFTEIAKKNNKVFMELLFWKDLKVAYEIEEGYDAVENKKTTNWTEEQEDELHRLHEDYIRNMPDEDEVTWICNNLIKQDRSRISVIKKLKQLDIVVIKKQKQPNREYSEAEITQITELVQEFREASDPMRFIMDKLDIKRPKKHIIDKILELGLVGNRKELRKKTLKNSNKDQHNSSDESNDSEDGDDEVNSIHYSLTSIYVLNAIKKVIDNDMKHALLWLIESLDEAATDLDVDESDIPLLPLTDECMTAVNNVDFQEVMQVLGIHKPSSIQETYWRIPGRWQANDIRLRSITITNVIEGNFIADDIIRQVDDSSDEDVEATFDRIRKSLVKNNVNLENIDESLEINSSKVQEELEKENSNSENIGFNKKISFNKRKYLLEDSDVEDDPVPVKKLVVSVDSDKDNISTRKNVLQKKKKKRLEDSDEENASDINMRSQLDKSGVENGDSEKNIASMINNTTVKENRILDDSDEDDDKFAEKKIFSIKKKKTILEDSDVEDDPMPPTKNKKVLDNSDEENCLTNNISPIKKNTILQYSTDEDVSNINMIFQSNEGEIKDNNSIKEQSSLENSDTDEEVITFVKKNKYFINDDSD